MPNPFLTEAVHDLQTIFPYGRAITVDCIDCMIGEAGQLVRDHYPEANKLVTEIGKMLAVPGQREAFTTRTTLDGLQKQFFEAVVYYEQHYQDLEKYFKVSTTMQGPRIYDHLGPPFWAMLIIHRKRT